MSLDWILAARICNVNPHGKAAFSEKALVPRKPWQAASQVQPGALEQILGVSEADVLRVRPPAPTYI